MFGGENPFLIETIKVVFLCDWANEHPALPSIELQITWALDFDPCCSHKREWGGSEIRSTKCERYLIDKAAH